MKKAWMAAVLAVSVLAGLIAAGGSASAAVRETDSNIELVQLCAGQDYVGEIQFRLDSSEMTVDGEAVPIVPEQEGIAPMVSQGRTMLPARALVEALNGSIGYEDGLCPVYLSVLTAALRYAKQSGADLVNMSLSTYRTPVLEQMIQDRIAQDVAVEMDRDRPGMSPPPCFFVLVLHPARNQICTWSGIFAGQGRGRRRADARQGR